MSRDIRIALVVGVGGVIGALARWGVDLLFDRSGEIRPGATLSINIVGCLLMGLLVACVLAAPSAHPLLRPFLGTGVLGGFTTFSAFAAETTRFLRDGSVALALVYVTASLVGSVGAAWLGLRLGRAWNSGRTR